VAGERSKQMKKEKASKEDEPERVAEKGKNLPSRNPEQSFGRKKGSNLKISRAARGGKRARQQKVSDRNGGEKSKGKVCVKRKGIF